VRRAIVRVGGPAAGVLVVVAGCLSATEVRLEITTTASCSKGITTQVLAGPHGSVDFGAAPVAVTQDCQASEPRIGTLTIVPAGARDEQFDLQVVSGVGVDPSTCRPGNLTGCIVARRRVSFLEHTAVRLPVLLSDRCIGVPCDADKTCDLGTCTPTIDCTESGCPRERGDVPVATDGGTDAGADVAVDAPVDLPDAAGACESVNTVVVDGQNAGGQLSFQGGDLVYANLDPAAGGNRQIRRVPARGGSPKLSIDAPNLVALAANAGWLAYATVVPGSMTFTLQPTGGMKQATGSGQEKTEAIGVSSTGEVMYVRSGDGSGEYHAVLFAKTVPTAGGALPGSIPEIVVDETDEWYGVSGGTTLYHFKSHSPDILGSMSGRSPDPDIAVWERVVYVAFSSPQKGIYKIPRAMISDAAGGTLLVPGMVSRSLAAHKSFVYYLEGTNLWRKDITTAAQPVLVTTVPGDARSLAADEGCVYWIENGGQRIMRHRAY
jgi:hypothetical protein